VKSSIIFTRNDDENQARAFRRRSSRRNSYRLQDELYIVIGWR
jgi:hypothetical protein